MVAEAFLLATAAQNVARRRPKQLRTYKYFMTYLHQHTEGFVFVPIPSWKMHPVNILLDPNHFDD